MSPMSPSCGIRAKPGTSWWCASALRGGGLTPGDGEGASVHAIQAHYDVSNDFYRLWLDPTMTYSCALWSAGDTLESAQLRKLDFHIRQARAVGARRVLDIGCGWGSMLFRLVNSHDVSFAVGLTLSEAQRSQVGKRGDPRTEVRLESWEEHESDEPYDAILSIGALEHFVRPSLSSEERVKVYRSFFGKA